ncbi:UDP-glucosyltransferase [Holotrichia oblita]|uniref:UDP-glucosyltransferase n=1 Tax=Holotrichia oblita TaxID=644536 RepID=A0ACB9TIT3_HOLOL|nr:UDP-glucosyltransferase [Holotrichia oblita]
MFFSIFFIITIVIEGNTASNILIVGVVDSPSHQIWYEVLIAGLIQNRHNITLISYADAKLKSDNYTVIKITGINELFSNQFNDYINHDSNYFHDIRRLWNSIIKIAEHDLQSNALKTILDYPKDSFDLIIFDMMMGHNFYPLVRYFGNPPIIGISPLGLSPNILDAMGTHTYSYYPMYYLKYTDQMTFLQRVENWLMLTLDNCFKWYYLRELHELAKNRFGQDIIPVEDVEKQFKILLANYDHILDYPLSLPPNIIPVGGLHTKRSTTLPDDLLKILDNSKLGVIYFSFGTNLYPPAFPMERKKMFLEVFSKLNQIVLWKYEGDDLEDVPKNVIIKKWFSQNDILAHENVVLFITHGGALSTQETMYHSVPIVGIPFLYDQLNNVAKMEARNFGRGLRMHGLTADILFKTIKEVLDNPM